MNDHALEKLIRLAAEAGDIDRFVPRPSLPNRFRLIRPMGALAAAAALMVLIGAPQSLNGPSRGALVGIDVRRLPSRVLTDGQRVERFRAQSQEHCTIMVIMRIWARECQCLAWELHRWEDGRPLEAIDPDEFVDIPLAISDAPPVQQLLIVAAARSSRGLPRLGEETDALMACLDRASLAAHGEDSTLLASAVQACLPDGVTVVPRSFVAGAP